MAVMNLGMEIPFLVMGLTLVLATRQGYTSAANKNRLRFAIKMADQLTQGDI
jgi:hypothetical protein